jgi:hypothetical protein
MRGIKVAVAAVGLSAGLAGTAVGLAGSASAAPSCLGGYPAAQCTVAINDSRVVAGQPLQFSATGFAAGETVTATVFSTPVVVGTYPATSAGTVSGSFTVPNLAPGKHTLRLVGATSGVVKSVSFVVVPNATAAGVSAGSADPGSLAFTGSDAAKTAGAGAVLLLGGGALIVAAKRRKHVNAAA